MNGKTSLANTRW